MEAKWEGKGSVSDIKWDDVLAEYDVREDTPSNLRFVPRN